MTAFAEWLDQQTPMERREWLTQVTSWLLLAGKLDDLAKRLTSNEFLAAKLKNCAPLAVIEDFVRSYNAMYKSDREGGRRILESFLSCVFVNGDALPIDDVVAWLQPLSDDHLFQDALNLALVDKWLPTGADRQRWQHFSLLLRRIRANKWRRQRHYREAEEELQSLLHDWALYDPVELKERSIIEWEIGYIAYLEGQAQDAVEMFRRSAARAASAGDEFGAFIGEFNACWAECHYHRTSPSSARKEFSRLREQLVSPVNPSPRIENWIYNIDARLFEVACAQQDLAEANRIRACMLASKVYQRGSADSRYQADRLRLDGRVALLERQWAKALANMAPFLELDLSAWGEQQPALVDFARSNQELSASYRDAGLALMQLGFVAEAMAAWRRGLECRDDDANLPYKDEIRQLTAGIQ